jgi:hypothetical protein
MCKNGQCRVVKIDVTCPFCIGHHVGVHLDAAIASIASVKIEVGKSWVIFRLLSLQSVTENGFWSPILRRPKTFGCQTYGDQKFSLAIFLVCHCGLAIFMKKYLKEKKELWKFQYFTMQKYNLKKTNPLKETKFFQNITTLSLIPNFNISHNIIFQKSLHKNRPTT